MRKAILITIVFMALPLSAQSFTTIPEPHVTLYGQVFIESQNGVRRLSSGTINWQLSKIESTATSVQYNIEIRPFADGQFDYRLNLPVKLMVDVANASLLSAPVLAPEDLVVGLSGEQYEISLVTILGQPVSILGSSVPLVNLNQTARSQSIQLDLLVEAPADDTDADGIPDEWELRYFANLSLSPEDDPDGDGLSNLEEFNAGTSPVAADTDGDGYSDYEEIIAGSDPLDPTSFIGLPTIYSKLYTFNDIDGDGIQDYGIFSYIFDELPPELQLFAGGANGATINSLTWPDHYDMTTFDLLKIPDLTADGIEEIGLFGQVTDPNANGRWQLFVRNPLNNARVSVFNWPSNWTEVTPQVLSDLTSDGVQEIALQGKYKSGDRHQLYIRDGANSSDKVALYSFPDFMEAPKYRQLADHNGDQIDDIGFFGVLKNKSKAQIRLVSGTDEKHLLGAYNYPAKWQNPSFEILSDITGDGVNDIGLFGTLASDGRPQLVSNSGASNKKRLSIHSWPNDFSSPKFIQVSDLNGDEIDDFGVFGQRNGLNQLMVKSATDRSIKIGTYNWPDKWREQSIKVLPDLTGDGIPEIGLFGVNKLSEEVELAINNGDQQQKTKLQIIKFGKDWHEKYFAIVEDIDLDGKKDFGFYGRKSQHEQLRMMIYSSGTSGQLIRTVTWQP